MTKKIVFTIILLFSTLILLYSCKDETDSPDIPEGIDMDLIQQVSVRFDEIYLAFNEKRFDDYISYYKIDDEQKNLMLESLKTNGAMFDSKYEIRNVVASKSDDGVISATIVYYAISSNTNGQSTIIEETMYYKLTEENGNIYISSYEAGPQRLIE